jgi:NitT/TauT family transport system ATP-binding protein
MPMADKRRDPRSTVEAGATSSASEVPGKNHTGASVTARHVEQTFGRGPGKVTAIGDVSFHVEPGEVLTVVGPSGCGKSTLLRLIAGLLAPTAGEVLVGNQRVEAPRRDIGFVFQKAILLPWRNIIENVLLPAEISGEPREAAREKARELLSLVELEGFETSRPDQLSGGMQQRVSIARALLHDPAVLLMDEPFGALDAFTRERMTTELVQLLTRQPRTVVFITHNISEAILLGHKVLVMSSRPSRVVDTVDIPLPWPRNLGMLTSEEAVAAEVHIRSCLESGHAF